MLPVRKHWERPIPYKRTLEQNKSQTIYYQEDCQFVQLRRSRKGTCLNDPAKFYPKPFKPLPYLENFPIIQTDGCGDTDYVTHRQNFHRSHLFPRQNPTCCANRIRNCPSLTINITTNSGYTRQLSHSTISINPSNATEEPWVQRKIIVPQGLRCCEDRNPCEHKQPDRNLCEFSESKEQRVIDLEGFGENINDEEGFVYVTRPPTISPLKTCWSFLNCKKKKIKRKGEIYMPSVMTKTDFKDCLVCPKHSVQIQEPNLLSYQTRNNGYFKSRLSTISESVMSISEYSSEEFMTPAERERREKEKKVREREYPPKVYTGTGNLMETCSSQPVYPEEQIYRWVCKPADEKKNKFNFGGFGTKRYICYKDAID